MILGRFCHQVNGFVLIQKKSNFISAFDQMRGGLGKTKTKINLLFLLRFSRNCCVVALAGSAVPVTVAGADIYHP